MSESIEKTIDISRILKSKMGAKAKFVPSFLVSWLKKTVHEDEVNRFLWESRHLQGTEWLTECVKYLKMNIQLEGVENLPDKNDGKLYTFVSNHPLGGQDGVALGSIIGTHYDGKFRYLVNDLLLNLPGLKPVSIGINKTGRLQVSTAANSLMAVFATCPGKRHLSQRVWSISAMWCLSISADRTRSASIASPDSATSICLST